MDPSATADQAAIRSGGGADSVHSDPPPQSQPSSSDLLCPFSLLGSSAEAEVSCDLRGCPHGVLSVPGQHSPHQTR